LRLRTAGARHDQGAAARYWQRVREICDTYDVLLVSDEVICAFVRRCEHVPATGVAFRSTVDKLRDLPDALFDNGLECRAESVVRLAPPLICDQSHFDEMEQILRGLEKAQQHL
jgi:adenosylmethionine-8-amino-7-oxononanoate aminotransferase